MKEVSWKDLKLNPMTAFGSDWFALAAGTERDGCNAMTVAWGHLGAIWGREGSPDCLPTAVVYVRPSRYTKEFMDREALFTLSLFDRSKRAALGYIGAHSGRDGDKAAAAHLTVKPLDGCVTFTEARETFVCRKLYMHQLDYAACPDLGAVKKQSATAAPMISTVRTTHSAGCLYRRIDRTRSFTPTSPKATGQTAMDLWARLKASSVSE